MNLAFGNFVLAAILVSYHLSPSDLCIALLPLGLFSQYLAEHTGIPRWARLGLLSSQCVFFLPPLHVILLARHVYVYAVIPILIMFLLSARIFASTRRQKLVPLGSAYIARSFPGGLFARSSQLKTDAKGNRAAGTRRSEETFSLHQRSPTVTGITMVWPSL